MYPTLIYLMMSGLASPVSANSIDANEASTGNESEVPPIYVTRCVDEDLETVWDTWTTAAGVRSFFARGSVVEPRIDGEYSVLFFPDNAAGTRGAEGMRIVAFEPRQRFAVTWNHPPQFSTIKDQRALVEYRFRELEDCGTEVRVKHFGWGQGDEWVKAREYFAGAWVTVLNRLEYRFQHGPLDWDELPEHLWYRGPSSK